VEERFMRDEVAGRRCIVSPNQKRPVEMRESNHNHRIYQQGCDCKNSGSLALRTFDHRFFLSFAHLNLRTGSPVCRNTQEDTTT
jgi:hypothetical protein